MITLGMILFVGAKKLAQITILTALLLVGEPHCSIGSTVSARPTSSSTAQTVCDSVSLSLAEADSITALIDRLDFTVEMLYIDVWEARQFAQRDSIYAERLQARLNRAEQRAWFDKLWRHPALWFMLGVYAGLQAVE